MLFILFTCKINYGYCLVSDHDIYIFNLMLPSYSFKTKFKFDENLMQKVCKTMIFEIILQKGIEKIIPF